MQPSPFRALTHYRTLPRLAGYPALLIALAARAPYAMIPLGTMTAVTASTGSVATGGLATGVVSVSTAIASPLIGRWSDRRGQRLVLLTLTPINALSLLALFVAALSGCDGAALWVACLIVGLTSLPVGSFTRARWAVQTTNPRDLAAAFSYESMADELVFVLGPALVGIAASAAAPAAPLVLAVILVIVAGIPFALTAPDTRRRASDGHSTTMDPDVARPTIVVVLLAVVPAIIVMVCIGTFFGSVQAGTTERAVFLGAPGRAGLVYALMGLGSAVMSLLVVALPDSVRLSTRVLIGGTGMALLMGLVTAQSSLLGTSLALLVTGLFVGPTMVTAFTTAERLAPGGGISVAMTSMQSSVTVGVSLGSALGGGLAAGLGPAGAYGLAIGAGVLVALVGLSMGITGRRGGPTRSPAHDKM